MPRPCLGQGCTLLCTGGCYDDVVRPSLVLVIVYSQSSASMPSPRTHTSSCAVPHHHLHCTSFSSSSARVPAPAFHLHLHFSHCSPSALYIYYSFRTPNLRAPPITLAMCIDSQTVFPLALSTYVHTYILTFASFASCPFSLRPLWAHWTCLSHPWVSLSSWSSATSWSSYPQTLSPATYLSSAHTPIPSFDPGTFDLPLPLLPQSLGLAHAGPGAHARVASPSRA